MRSAKTLIRLGGCSGWSESMLGSHWLRWFCRVAAHIAKSWIISDSCFCSGNCLFVCAKCIVYILIVVNKLLVSIFHALELWHFSIWYMSLLMTKPKKWFVRPAKTLILLCSQWVAEDLIFLHADSEDSGQTWQMPRLIWVLAGCKGLF